MSNTNLLPCPFCGGTDLIESEVWAFVCNTCDAFGPRKTSAYTWESRVETDPMKKAAPELFAVLKRWDDMWSRYIVPPGGGFPMVYEEHEQIRIAAESALASARGEATSGK
jgi:hypothetical protein